MKPSYWVCGGGSHINCTHFDDINGCWHDEVNVFSCLEFHKLNEEAEQENDEEEWANV